MNEFIPRVTVRDHEDQHILMVVLAAVIEVGQEGPLVGEDKAMHDRVVDLFDSVKRQHDKELEETVKAHLN